MGSRLCPVSMWDLLCLGNLGKAAGKPLPSQLNHSRWIAWAGGLHISGVWRSDCPSHLFQDRTSPTTRNPFCWPDPHSYKFGPFLGNLFLLLKASGWLIRGFNIIKERPGELEDKSMEIQQTETWRQKESGKQNKMKQKQNRVSKSCGTVKAKHWKYSGYRNWMDPRSLSSIHLCLAPH